MRSSLVPSLLAVSGLCVALPVGARATVQEARPVAGEFAIEGGPVGVATINVNFTGLSGGQPYTGRRLIMTGELLVNGDSAPAECVAFIVPPVGEPFQVQLSESFITGPDPIPFRVNAQIWDDVTSVAGDWTVVIEDQSDTLPGTDATVRNLVISIDDGMVPAAITYAPLAAGQTSGTVSIPVGGVKWVKFTMPSSALADDETYLDIKSLFIGAAYMGLYNSDGFLRASDLGTGSDFSRLTFGSGQEGRQSAGLFNGANGDLDAGTYWLALGFFGTTFGSGGFDAISTSGFAGDVGFTIKRGARPLPPPPSPRVDLGTLGNGLVTDTKPYDARQVRWYGFTTPADASFESGSYVDIWTLANDFAGEDARPNDTEIGLFRATGNVLTRDDEAGFIDPNNHLSALTFGTDAVTRSTGDANPAQLNGGGGFLAAGTYYLAIGGGRTFFNSGFSTFGVNPSVGSITVKIGSNFGPPPCGRSDVAGANQQPGADGQLTADDIIVFLGWYFAADTRADGAGPNQSTTPDGALTADDIIVFLSRYFAGC